MSLRLIPYLVMEGNAREAIDFYEKALDAQILSLQAFGDMPENPDFPLPEEAKNRIAHAMLKVGESELMFSDAFPGQPIQAGNHVTICIQVNDAEQAKKLYDALQQDGKVNMPLQETFFSPAFGNVRDKFGVTFQIYTESNKAE